jgi:hypothetical protein
VPEGRSGSRDIADSRSILGDRAECEISRPDARWQPIYSGYADRVSRPIYSTSYQATIPTRVAGIRSRLGEAQVAFLGRAFRNRSPPILPGVIREIDIWRVAVLMVNRYADEAKANSDRRAEELATEGDHVGAAIWRRVTVAIEQLTDTTGPPH